MSILKMSSGNPSPPSLLPIGEGIKPPLIVIVGPTAVGKTEISSQLAEGLGGEIVSADSRLFYRGMDIGTAKPTLEERRRVPHHLIDVADPRTTWSLALFQQVATEAIAGIHMRGHLPFLVGGTGQYVHAVTHGWKPPITSPDTRLRAELEARAVSEGYEALYEELQNLDPSAAEKIDPRNVRRTVRALEVIHLTGRKFSEQRGQLESPYRLLTIGLTRPRPEIYVRVDARIESMFAAGLLDEVQRLLDSGCSPDLPSMSAIGYRECVSVLAGRMEVEEAKSEMRRLTRIFVRRQANWFKLYDPSIHWFEAGKASVEEIEEAICAYLKADG
ncbi:MAG: tRNA (adenosine(37)-N6)-dimethylallyltransferase MiaA [Anaerolineales bacterium]